MAGNNCFNCGFYKPYYVKGCWQFEKLGIGECAKSNQIVNKHGTCEMFSSLNHWRSDRKQLALNMISNHLNVLVELKQLLEEDEEEVLEAMLQRVREKKQKQKE